jgi:hypothetical protein
MSPLSTIPPNKNQMIKVVTISSAEISEFKLEENSAKDIHVNSKGLKKDQDTREYSHVLIILLWVIKQTFD